ncbi:MAG TPA: hypothetical protein VJ597_01620 [Sphingomicrobium sp.]|jgi:hypothetical protein|nr:hypothetical protein [Sphingomicrobium sp.]
MTDRGLWVAGRTWALNVRRLMYQSLIWPGISGNEPSRLGSALDSENMKRLANALVDRVRRDVELGRDLLG